jgi:hypothetical protein
MINYKIEDGTEIYKDIRRDKTPDWPGWRVIDDFKNKYGQFMECQDKCGDLIILYKLFKNKNYE